MGSVSLEQRSISMPWPTAHPQPSLPLVQRWGHAGRHWRCCFQSSHDPNCPRLLPSHLQCCQLPPKAAPLISLFSRTTCKLITVLSALSVKNRNQKGYCLWYISYRLFFFLPSRLISGQQGITIKNYSTRSLLTVTNVTEEHFGNYTCVAANKLGMTNASLPLNRK